MLPVKKDNSDGQTVDTVRVAPAGRDPAWCWRMDGSRATPCTWRIRRTGRSIRIHVGRRKERGRRLGVQCKLRNSYTVSRPPASSRATPSHTSSTTSFDAKRREGNPCRTPPPSRVTLASPWPLSPLSFPAHPSQAPLPCGNKEPDPPSPERPCHAPPPPKGYQPNHHQNPYIRGQTPSPSASPPPFLLFKRLWLLPTYSLYSPKIYSPRLTSVST